MAGAGYKLFNTGDVLTAAQVNTYLQEQTVMVFADSAARTTALSGVLAEGMVSYLQDTNAVEVYNGSAWVGVSGAGDVTEVQAGTGISVASGTGPIPVVTNTMATAIDAEGDLIIGDAADAFQRLAIGSNGNVLTVDTAVDGKIKWAAPASGGSLKLIQRTSFSNVASQAFDDVFTSTYKAYRVVIENINGATGTDDLQMQYRYAGPTTQTTNYFGPRFYLIYTGSVTASNMNGATEQTMMNQIGSGAEPTSGTIDFYQVGNASARPYAYAQMQCAFEGTFDFSYAWNSTARVYTGFLLKSSSSNVTGTVSIYGLATS
jgi:hypothetical protein